MVNSIARNIPRNYLRNGNFEDGTLEFWDLPQNYITYAIEPDPLHPSKNRLYGLAAAGGISITHKDFIPVHEGEIAVLRFTDIVPSTGYSIGTFNCYDANMNLIQWMFTPNYTGTDNPEEHSVRLRIPPDTAFILFKYGANIRAGGYVGLQDVSLRVEPSTEALTGVIETDVQVLEDLEAIAVNSYKEIPFKPEDPDIAYRVIGIRMSCNAPTGGGSGTHYMTLIVRNKAGPGVSLIQGRYAYNKNIIFDSNMWTTEITTASPSDQVAIHDVIGSIIATKDTPLYIGYSNNTNVVQSNKRQTRIFYEVIRRNNAVNFG